jgi:hypothetical protein
MRNPRRFPPPWTVEEHQQRRGAADSPHIAKLPELTEVLNAPSVVQSLLARRPVSFRHFGSSVGDAFEFHAGPSPHSADMGGMPAADVAISAAIVASASLASEISRKSVSPVVK